MVAEGSVVDAQLDHTSILQLFAERFGAGSYSAAVEAQKETGIQSVSVVIDASIPAAPNVVLAVSSTFPTWREPVTAMQHAFVAAAEGIAKQHGVKALAQIPELARWLASLEDQSNYHLATAAMRSRKNLAPPSASLR
jgi:phospholipase C